MENLKALGNLGYSNHNSFDHGEHELEKFVDVKSDDNCGFCVVLVEHIGHGEDIHHLICHALVRELNLRKSDYMFIFGSGECFKYIRYGLYFIPSKVKEWNCTEREMVCISRYRSYDCILL